MPAASVTWRYILGSRFAPFEGSSWRPFVAFRWDFFIYILLSKSEVPLTPISTAGSTYPGSLCASIVRSTVALADAVSGSFSYGFANFWWFFILGLTKSAFWNYFVSRVLEQIQVLMAFCMLCLRTLTELGDCRRAKPWTSDNQNGRCFHPVLQSGAYVATVCKRGCWNIGYVLTISTISYCRFCFFTHEI